MTAPQSVSAPQPVVSVHHEEPGHGHSPAAWGAVVVMLVGFLVGTVAFYIGVAWLVWASTVLVIVGPAFGWILAKAGYGIAGPKFTPKPH